MSPSEIATRYQQVIKRSFDRHMDLFLTVQFMRSPSDNLAEVTAETYQTFQLETTDWTHYIQSHQAKSISATFGQTSTIQALDKAIKDWWTENKVRGLTEYQQIHSTNHCISKEAFHSLFTTNTELACAYCHITESEFKTLIKAGQIQTKRLRTRGSTFEIDCEEPHLGYAEGNLALCCYWCNNAKTDEFTRDEFQPVADAIEQVWRQRLKNTSLPK